MKNKVVKFVLLILALALLAACTSTPATQAPAAEPEKAAEAPAAPAKEEEEAKPEPADPAADWPSKSITLIVPFSAGGATDVTGRVVADYLSKAFGQTVVVVNKTGAGGSVGTAEVVNAKPDGYTIVETSIGPTTIVPYLSDVKYTYEDLTPVSQLFDVPVALTVNATSDIETLQDFVDFAKENPGKVTIGTSGSGNIHHLVTEQFAQTVGIEVTHVPFDGASQAVTALLGDHVTAIVSATAEVAPHHASGDFKILGLTTEKRFELLPDVPTFKEEGIDVVAGVWYGIFAPAGTPEAIVAKLDAAFRDALEDQKVKDGFMQMSILPDYLNSADFAARVASEAKNNQQLLKDIGLVK